MLLQNGIILAVSAFGGGITITLNYHRQFAHELKINFEPKAISDQKFYYPGNA